jgi:hypothetical protein
MPTENALYVRKGAAVGLPPSDQVALLFDASGSPLILDSTGTRTALGGGPESSALSWISTVADFVAGKDALLTKVNWWSGCNSFDGIDRAPATGTTGAAELVRITGSTNLKLRGSSGTGANSFRTIRNRAYARAAAASVQDDLCANVRTSRWALASKVIINAVNATCSLYGINMTDEATADCYLGVAGATSQVNFALKVGSAGAQDTGVAIGTLGTTEHTLIMVCDGTTVSAYIDLVSAAVASGASNTAANAAGHFGSLASNGATASNVSIDLLSVVAFGA